MKYPAYPNYKDSGVEWLGEIPEEWIVSRIGFEAWVRARLGWKGLKAEEYVDDGYIFLSTPNIKDREIDFDNVNYINSERYDESPEIQLQIGDVLLAKDGSTLGTVNIVKALPNPATVNSSIAVITPYERLNGFFLKFLLDSEYMKAVIQLFRGGMGVPHLFQEDINKFYIPIPLLKTQKKIATFLDTEIAKIDGLIKDYEELITLLQEKRQTLISHAVTRGLSELVSPDDPEFGEWAKPVKFKDSGVEWLGEIPEGWEVKPLRYIIESCQNGISKAGEAFGTGFPFVSYSDVYNNYELPETVSGLVESTAEERFTCSVIKGDIFFTRTSETVDEIALTSVCMKTIKDAVFAGFLIRIRPRDNTIDSLYAKYYFRSSILRSYFVKELNLVTRASLNQELLKNLHVVLPNKKEMIAIGLYTEKMYLNYDQLIETINQSISLLKEHRSALITNAVTGKINVEALV